MSFPRYPKYRDSGVEWLGEVPEHWAVMPIRYSARLESGHTPSRDHPEYWDNCTVPWFTLSDVWQIREEARSVIYETREKISELGIKNSSARRLPAGTVMLSRTASVGFAAIMGVEMATTQDFANWVCGPSLAAPFLLNVFRAMRGEFKRLMMGSTHNTIYMPDIQAFRFALPPLPEQTAITAFLDRETAKIDALVAEQERLIELLKEKRQAVISHAVTKGLNPDAPMKDSGVEWLGEIPAHWDIYPCQRLKRPGTYITYGIVQAGPHCEDGVPYIRTSDMAGAVLREGDYLKTTKEIAASYSRSRVCEGDLVVAIQATVGKGLLVPSFLDGANLTQGTAKISPGERLLPAFLLEAFNSDYCQESIRRAAKGSTFLEITLDSLRRIQLAVPPRNEQQHIVSFLRSETARYTSLTGEAQRAIELLQERRTALISAAVTGQIDVRDVERRAA